MKKETKAAHDQRRHDAQLAGWADYAIDDWRALPWWRRWWEWVKG
jgi:hypothetical protein